MREIGLHPLVDLGEQVGNLGFGDAAQALLPSLGIRRAPQCSGCRGMAVTEVVICWLR